MAIETTIQGGTAASRAPAQIAAEAAAESRLSTTGRFASPLRAGVMLLLEDAANAGLLSECLREQGYRNLIVVEQLGQVRQMLLNDLPDLLLLDADMPGDEGLDLLAWIRSEKLLKHTAVIVLSDTGDSEQKLRALELGAADFLHKPVDARELALRMRNLLANSAGSRVDGGARRPDRADQPPAL